MQRALPVGAYSTNVRRVTLGGSSEKIVTANPQRVYVGFGPSTAAQVKVSPLTNVGAAGGVLIPSNGGMIEIFWERHGPLVTMDWYAQAIMGTVLEVWETFLLPGSPQ